MSRGGAADSEPADAARPYDQAPIAPHGSEDERGQVWTDDDFASEPDLGTGDAAALVLAASPPTRTAIGPAIRRQAAIWCAIGLVGLALGAGLYVKRPPPYKAVTTILLKQGGSQLASDEMLTDVALAQSRTVAAVAMRKLGLPVTPRAVLGFAGHYTATSITDRVLQILVKASSAQQAVQWANVVAASFLQVLEGELQSQLNLTTTALASEISQDQQRVNLLTAQVASLSAHQRASGPHPKLTRLITEQRQAATTLKGLEQAASAYEASSKVANAATLNSSQILDKAIAVPRSHLRYPVLYLGGGLVGGLVVGLGLVVILAMVSTRPRRRDDVARALGGTVQLSVGRVRLSRWRGRSLLTAERNAALRRIVAGIGRALPDTPGLAALAVIAPDDPGLAAMSVVSLALGLARQGRRVIVADLSPGTAAGRLLGISGSGVQAAESDDYKILLAVPEPDDFLPAGPLRSAASPAHSGSTIPALDHACQSADVLLTLTTLEPGLGSDHLASWSGAAIVILTAGKSTATRISAVGEMIRLAGVSLISAILTGADKSDESLGAVVPPSAGLDEDGGQSGPEADVGPLVMTSDAAMASEPSGALRN